MENKNVQGMIFDIDHFVVHDGKGIRTCIYVKGCPLHCEWCHSPESQKSSPQILFAASRCRLCGLCVSECTTGAQKITDRKRIFQRELCDTCTACTQVCNQGALTVSGKCFTAKQVVKEVVADKPFFQNSGGGVTISGGEVLMQADFVTEILRLLKEEQIHTIIETSGYGDMENLLKMAEYTDIFFYDFKLGDKEKFRHYIGGDVDVVFSNLRRLRKVTDQIVLRMPVIPGITDTLDNIDSLYETACKNQIHEINFLPYNTSAGAKYEWCGRTYKLGEIKSDIEKLEWYKKMAPKGTDVFIMG